MNSASRGLWFEEIRKYDSVLFCLVRKDEDADYFTELNKKIFFFCILVENNPVSWNPYPNLWNFKNCITES